MRVYLVPRLVLLVVALSVTTTLAEPISPQPERARWARTVIRLSVSTSLTEPSPNLKLNSDVNGALRRSLDAWEAVANVHFELTPSQRLGLSPAGPAGDGTSLITIAQTPENILFFENGITDATARTRVFVDRKGNITEGDIVLNPFQQFSTDGSIGTFDLQSTLTHEIGHLLGLKHTNVLGSTMHEIYGRNGLFGLQNVDARTLSETDVSAVRALYGPDSKSTACCGRISGKVSISAGKQRGDLSVWVESAENGTIYAEGTTASDGTFRIGGLPAGKYRVLIQSGVKEARQSFSSEIGPVIVNAEKTTNVVGKGADAAPFQLLFTGANSQLANTAVPVNRGRSYSILLGGRNLDPRRLTVGSNSPFLEVASSTVKLVDFGDEYSVLSVNVRVDASAPLGDYSLFVRSSTGEKRFLAGALTVEEFEDPFSFLLADPF